MNQRNRHIDSKALRDVMSGGNVKPRGSMKNGKAAKSRKHGRPGPKKKVDDEVIVGLLREGYSQADIARQVGLSDQAISKRVRSLGHRAVAAMFHADSQLWGVELKTMAQLAELNGRLLNIARGKKATNEHVVAAAREIRQQLDFQMRFQDALKVQQRFEEFRETVLFVLDELGQELGVDLREKVMDKFRRKTEARLMLTRPRLSEGRGEKYEGPSEAEGAVLAEIITGPRADPDPDPDVEDDEETDLAFDL